MAAPISIIFCGTPDIAVPYLHALQEDPDIAVKLVITQPDKAVGRKQALTPPPVKVAAQEHGIPVEQPEDINQFEIRNLNFDFLLTVAYGQIIGENLLELPAIAPLNIHYSLLPRWRGAAPVQHAILAGDTVTGVTIQKMVKRLDAGPIFAQEEVPISPRETTQTLLQKLVPVTSSLLLHMLKNPLQPQQQDESKATFCKKLSREDGIVSAATMTAEEIDRRVRALVPWPGVTCTIGKEEVKIHRTSLEPADDAFPLPCKNRTTLFIARIQSPGKNILQGNEWARGNSMS